MTTSNKARRDKDSVLRDLMTAVSVCHNVTPIIEEGQRIFHASSPDEIALVKFGEDCKFMLQERTSDTIKILNPINVVEEYQILACFPFSSETKRMGILVRHV
mmetsp:Transcript_30797/g.28029  ORF Transcript_30797/g.28029 Transcript_30797/m.28029 type:complete len:103 (-) Transcript_30797:1521-1829(-)